MINVLFAAHRRLWPDYEAPLQRAFEGAELSVELSLAHPPEEVDYIVYAPSSWLQDFTPYTRAKAVLNLWAGVETAVHNKTLALPFARMVEPGLSEGMRDWVVAHVMRHHIGLDAHAHNSKRLWDDTAPPLARERPLVILGLGELGQLCGQALASLGFPVRGWSRSTKSVKGLRCFSGNEGLPQALQGAQGLILLLPLTDATENIVTKELLSQLAPGAFLLNPGRGGLIDDDALVAALDNGQLSHATLDTFRVEPLPTDHRFWAHPKITITPHIASTTRPLTASMVIAEQIKRAEQGLPLLHLVDRGAGY
ncbi:MAG: glyoxylate/hydroxypyruvate reductase A [Pseudomonadota bacterium]